MKILVIGGLPSSLVNFRGDILKAFVSKGHSVFAMAGGVGREEVKEKLSRWGVKYKHYYIERSSLNVLSDLHTLWSLWNSLREIKPDIVFAYTIKPIIWGGVVSRVFKTVDFYPFVTGLGYAFQGAGLKGQLLRIVVTVLYKQAMKKSKKVIFQNPDNLTEFVERGIVPEHKCVMVNGSGVNLSVFEYCYTVSSEVVFLSIGRLLGQKGFREYAKAAEIVKIRYPDVIFQLLGPEDPSPDAISLNEVKQWVKQGVLDYLGSTSDVRPYIRKSNIFVLPSYHEGMPRTVLEAMAIGRPILTTDVPGCRETVDSGVNGYLVPKADAEALAKRMIWFIENRSQWELMGKMSRKLAEDKYDVNKVNTQLMEIMSL